jgi:hypothetical protein
MKDMAERELSGKDLLEQLYRGLDTVPATVETEMDAQELLGLAPTAPTDKSSAGATYAEVPASRAQLVRAPLLILCGIAVAGTIAAAVLHQSEPDFDPAALAVDLPSPAPLPVEVVNLAPPQPEVVLTNPFDPTEKFTFPPGTSKADAREQMANLLMERAIGRKAHLPTRSRKLASDHESGPSGRGS